MKTELIIKESVSHHEEAPVAVVPKPGRYPVAPFVAMAQEVLDLELTIEGVGVLAGISRATAYRRERDGLTEQEADHLACHVLRMHPCCVWPEWFNDVDEFDDEIELADELVSCA